MAKLIPYKIGDRDKFGRRIVEVSPEGWYKDEHGAVRDPEGYEWFGGEGGGSNEKITKTPETRLNPDEQRGQVITVRDFKIAMTTGSFASPQQFIDHWRPTIEATMVETGWDYANVEKPIRFGEAQDGYAHIYVTMKKKAWKNRENIYAGAKTGQHGAVQSAALAKVGALDTHIYGAVEIDRTAQDILTNGKNK